MPRNILWIVARLITENKMGMLRFFHTALCSQKGNTSAMAFLRKKTGYTFANIRQALELNGDDLEKAEKWLAEKAKEMGWSKVVKVQDRKAVEGLIGIAVKDKKIAMVEVNCETDFVSRNEKFRSLVELVAKTCIQQPVLTPGLDMHQVELNSEELGKLKADNCSLADHVALLVGSVGENTTLRKAFCYETSRNDVHLAFGVHPCIEHSDIMLGKYGSFISYQVNSEDTSDAPEIAKGICTHIIGMNPVKIGEYGSDEPSENGNEPVLIHQDFLLDDTLTVGQLLTDSGMTILNFKRFQCGDFNEKNQSIENSSEAQSLKANN